MHPGPKNRLVLASASPRRRELLREHGYTFDIVVAPLIEPVERPSGLSPPAWAEAVSYYKAAAAVPLVPMGTLLAGDTIVALGDCVIGKPVDRDDARRILAALSGTRHRVITALTLLDAESGRRRIAHDQTWVTLKGWRPDQLESYLESGDWEGKAGAYGIQDHGDEFVEQMEGSFTNVVGLPMELLAAMLAEWNAGGAVPGVTPKAHPADLPRG